VLALSAHPAEESVALLGSKSPSDSLNEVINSIICVVRASQPSEQFIVNE
jgi:hypothetical protein